MRGGRGVGVTRGCRLRVKCSASSIFEAGEAGTHIIGMGVTPAIVTSARGFACKFGTGF